MGISRTSFKSAVELGNEKVSSAHRQLDSRTHAVLFFDGLCTVFIGTDSDSAPAGFAEA